MNDTNNGQTGGGFGGNSNGGNNFNTNNTPRPNNAGNDMTPKFSGMPTAPGASNTNGGMNAPRPASQQPQAPKPPMPSTSVPPPPAAAPMPMPKPPMPAQTFQQPPKPTTPPPMPAPASVPPSPSFVPPPAPKPQPTMAPKPTVVNPVTPNNTFGPKPAPAVVGVKKSNTGLIVTLIVILVIILAGIAIWILKPFAFMQAPATNSNIEEKVEKPVTKPSDSLFPSSVVNKPAATSSKPAPTKTSNTYSATDQQKITDYLGANINKLAKTTGYTVDDVSFDGPGRAIVSYSKNGVSRSAVVNAYVDSSGAVRVTSFMVLTK